MPWDNVVCESQKLSWKEVASSVVVTTVAVVLPKIEEIFDVLLTFDEMLLCELNCMESVNLLSANDDKEGFRDDPFRIDAEVH